MFLLSQSIWWPWGHHWAQHAQKTTDDGVLLLPLERKMRWQKRDTLTWLSSRSNLASFAPRKEFSIYTNSRSTAKRPLFVNQQLDFDGHMFKLFCSCFLSTSRRALGHKGSPTQLHALPPFIEISPALKNINLLQRVSAPEHWQGIIHLVRSLARL